MKDATLSLDTFDYPLPSERIAQEPLARRDDSRLLLLDRNSGTIDHRRFGDIIDLLQAGDVLVANNSRVMSARIFGRKSTGAKVEILLLEQKDDLAWVALVGGRRVGPGTAIKIDDRYGASTGLAAQVIENLGQSQRLIRFSEPVEAQLERLGHTPLPPYIHHYLSDDERYQTVYSRPTGSAAAPTAGLHFTADLLLALRQKGVSFETVTLHVGLDTFKPVEADDIRRHPMHSEWMQLTAVTARRINQAKLAGKRIIAVGTTSVRVLESAAWRSAGEFGSLQQVSLQSPPGYCPWKPVAAFEGRTDLFIYPGYHFRVVDGLITNFHLPQSTLLMLVSAFAGVDKIKRAYQAALDSDYRFLSFGDAMLIL